MHIKSGCRKWAQTDLTEVADDPVLSLTGQSTIYSNETLCLGNLSGDTEPLLITAKPISPQLIVT